MQFSIRSLPPAQLAGGAKTGCLVLAALEGETLARAAQAADKAADRKSVV